MVKTRNGKRNQQPGTRLGLVHLGEWARRANRGQAIILIALIFIGLVAVVGLVVDGGTVLVRYAQLRRGVDAAGIQASNQFREFRPLFNNDGSGVSLGRDMYSAAAQVFAAQGLDPTKMRLYACLNNSQANNIAGSWNQAEQSEPPFVNNSSPPIGTTPDNAELHDQLCTDPPRKLVRVDGRIDVGLPFLSVVGWRFITLDATTITEAAAIDLAIVLDRSGSMSSESGNNPQACAPNSCHPFEEVRSNAVALVDKLFFPYDHIVIIEFDRYVRVFDPTPGVYTFTLNTNFLSTPVMISDKATALDALNNYLAIQTAQTGDPEVTIQGIPNSNVSTNIGGALQRATAALVIQGRRRGAVWMTLLLTDGAPNATDPYYPAGFNEGFCPPSTWDYGSAYTVTGYIPNTSAQPPYANPLCLRLNYNVPYSQIERVCIYTDTSKCGPGTTVTGLNSKYEYDAADFARDQADYMASNGIVAFVIGLGPLVTGLNPDGTPKTPMYTSTFDGTTPREPNAGERLLRYIADVGTQPNTWQCRSNYWATSTPIEPNRGEQCGNYWYAATGAGLQAVFDAIANRIFTRITR